MAASSICLAVVVGLRAAIAFCIKNEETASPRVRFQVMGPLHIQVLARMSSM